MRMRLGAVGVSGGIGVKPPSVSASIGPGGISVEGTPPSLEAEAIVMGADAPAVPGKWSATLQQSAIPTVASRYQKYLAVNPARAKGGKYAGVEIQGQAKSPVFGGGGAPPSLERGSYGSGGGGVSLATIVAAALAVAAVGGVAYWKLVR